MNNAYIIFIMSRTKSLTRVPRGAGWSTAIWSILMCLSDVKPQSNKCLMMVRINRFIIFKNKLVCIKWKVLRKVNASREIQNCGHALYKINRYLLKTANITSCGVLCITENENTVKSQILSYFFFNFYRITIFTYDVIMVFLSFRWLVDMENVLSLKFIHDDGFGSIGSTDNITSRQVYGHFWRGCNTKNRVGEEWTDTW